MSGITGNDEIDAIFDFLAGDSEKQAERFEFQIGDIVIATEPAYCEIGTIGVIRGRRNGYPEPFFHGYWFPVYYFAPFNGKGGGEFGPMFFRLATEEEKAGTRKR